MRIRRSLPHAAWIFTASLLVASVSGPARAEDDAAREFVLPEVQAVFESGGLDAVEDWMRAMLKRQKKAGRKIASTGAKPKCGSCHDSLKTYTQRPNASEDLRAFLAAEL